MLQCLINTNRIYDMFSNLWNGRVECVVYISFCKNTCYNYPKYIRRGFMLHRHDISDDMIKDILPGTNGNMGRPAKDTRKFINAVLWIIRTVAWFATWVWRLEKYNCRWRNKGVWEQILETVKTHDNSELIIIDSTYCKCHQHASGARQEIGLTSTQKSM